MSTHIGSWRTATEDPASHRSPLTVWGSTFPAFLPITTQFRLSRMRICHKRDEQASNGEQAVGDPSAVAARQLRMRALT